MEKHREDLEYSKRDLQTDTTYKLSLQAGGNKIYIENLVISPILVTLSFSLRGCVYVSDDGSSATQSTFGGDILDLLLTSIGITLSEVTDIDFRCVCVCYRRRSES